MTTDTSTDTRTSEPGSDATEQDIKSRFEGFQTRAKAEWATAEAKARAELQAFPGKLKTGATQAFERLRSGLDLPRRGEVAALSARIDELAGKLAEYETQAAPPKAKRTAQKD